MMRKFTAVLTTDGKGYWSNVAKDVKIIGMDMPYISDEGDFGELCVYFDTMSWNVNVDGLIYTDRQFRSQLQELLTGMGYDGNDISYSEQGMQGNDYVSLDVGKAFIKSYNVSQLESIL
jgi:hypothetical protein